MMFLCFVEAYSCIRPLGSTCSWLTNVVHSKCYFSKWAFQGREILVKWLHSQLFIPNFFEGQHAVFDFFKIPTFRFPKCMWCHSRHSCFMEFAKIVTQKMPVHAQAIIHSSEPELLFYQVSNLSQSPVMGCLWSKEENYTCDFSSQRISLIWGNWHTLPWYRAWWELSCSSWEVDPTQSVAELVAIQFFLSVRKCGMWRMQGMDQCRGEMDSLLDSVPLKLNRNKILNYHMHVWVHLCYIPVFSEQTVFGSH